MFRKGPRRHASQIFVGGSASGKDAVRVLPLGGIGNVTKNLFVYEYYVDGKLRDILIVDCGIGFPEPEMYGVDLLIPDTRYLEGKREYIRGIVFSHGHDDHIGGIPYVYPRLVHGNHGTGGRLPMYAPTLAAAFTNIKLVESHIWERVRPVRFDETIVIGPFRISFIRVTHSVPDTSHLIIETPIGILYHGTDFKFDATPLDGKVSELVKINSVGKRGVLCMLTDSLGSERPGMTPSEQIVAQTIEKELDQCSGKFLFTTQSSNVSRIQLAVEKALKRGRKVAFLGRSIDKNVEEAVKLGYMKFGKEHVIRDRDLKHIHPSKQCLIVAGSQGQPDSALSRIAGGTHRFVKLAEGDTVVISADPIPGHEYNVNRLIDAIYKCGSRVSYSDIMEDLHVSGHGSQGDLMLLLSAVSPRYVMPIGGTYKHLMQYRRLAQDLGYAKSDVLIPFEGEAIEFRPHHAPKVVERVELENIMIDGLGIGDVGAVVLQDRQTIAKEGIVVVVIPVLQSTGRLTGQPDIISRGFVYMKQSGALVARAKHIVSQFLRHKRGAALDRQFMRKSIEDSLGKFLKEETGRSPLVVPVIVNV